ncbi:hypothetical protein CTI12_AA290770 [Artemisia annua]|uniref:Uncharacterized protein n=1 Tax=Artemisia annua TaxID=35608 RepID=A0A2U1N7H4_ARTAN|nr:hypothetical protein CTI12_AA290770 [Artemisia annua]
MADERKKVVEDEWKSLISQKLSRAHDFPRSFLFGAATSAYQVEGAANEGGKGPSIWDAFARTEGKIIDGKNGDLAVDQYHRYKEDVDLIAKLGFSAYRFSISWSRIYPETCFENFGDRVKRWITINEPLQQAVNGYFTGLLAPGRCECQPADPYLAAHHQLLAHAEAVSIYRKKFKDVQGGEIGLVVDCEWAEPLTDKEEDKIAAVRRVDFQLGWYLDPIYFGEYPKSMQERLGDLLPKFSEKDKETLRTSLDFIGLNHYTSRFVSHYTNQEQEDYYRTQEATMIGMDDEDNDTSPLHEMLDDKLRVAYFKGYLASVSLAIKEGSDVRGYFAWSLLDNFEWHQGYTKRFGLIYVDYKNGLARHPKSSAYWFQRFLKGEDGKSGKEDGFNLANLSNQL